MIGLFCLQTHPALFHQLQQISSLSKLTSSLHVGATAALGGDAQVRSFCMDHHESTQLVDGCLISFQTFVQWAPTHSSVYGFVKTHLGATASGELCMQSNNTPPPWDSTNRLLSLQAP